MSIDKLNQIKVTVGNLEETAEGQLRGGFAPIGGIDPLVDVNGGCNNHSCNVGCGHTNTGICSNNGCNNGCPTSPVTDGKSSSIGITFSI